MIQSTGGISRSWRVHSAGQEHGPYTREEIEQFMASGQLAADAMLFGPGMSEWQAAYPQISFSPTPTYSAPTRHTRQSPQYMGIRLGAATLLIFGVLSFVIGLLMVAFSFTSKPSDSVESAAIASRALIGAGGIIYGIFFMFLGSLGYAIRDIARNSFRW